MAQRSVPGKSLPQAKPVASGQAVGSRPKPAVTAEQQRMASKSTSASDADEDEEDDDYDDDGNMFVDMLEDNASWLTSMVFHAVVFIAMLLYIMPQPEEPALPIVVAPTLEPIEEPEEPEKEEVDFSDIDDVPISDEVSEDPEAKMSEQDTVDKLDEGADAMSQELTDVSSDFASVNENMDKGFGKGTSSSAGTGRGKTGAGMGMGGRGERRSGAGGRGATKESEDAVDLALKWLAAHQLKDGSWNFDHRKGNCQGRCDKQGSFSASKNAATALGLLPFLGAGQTHLQGKYQANVAAGLNYLMSTMKVNGDTGSWHEKVGNSYSHGLATLAMTEAYAMSNIKPVRRNKPGKSPAEMTQEERDKYFEDKKRAKEDKKRPKIPRAKLKNASQAAINWIRDAQDMKGGGWRYGPKTPGDTSVVGWMLMGLKSGVNSRLRVERKTVVGANHFLDTVQGDDYGSLYHYMADKKREAGHATTAIGLLCRMYLGWSRDHQGIIQGAENLDQWGPVDWHDQYVLQLLCHAGHAPLRRRPLGKKLEPKNA